MRVKDEKGYSLVEVLIVVAILVVVGGMICSIILSATQIFSRSKDEVDVQSEAQTTINWFNDMLAEAGYGVTYKEDAVEHVLEIYNEANIYKITYTVDSGQIYCEEQQFQDGGSRLVLTSQQLLAEYVSDFSINTATLTDDNPVVTITLGMEKGEQKVNLVRNVTLRNGVLINKELSEVYEGKIEIVSSVEKVVVYPIESYQAKGATTQFTARVTGIGFPSQMVTWSIADRTGLKDGTTIDEHTGVLTIDPDEDMSAFVVQATSVDTDKDGNRVSSTNTSGIVKIMTISSVQIVNAPTTAQEVGTTLNLIALVHGENLDEMGSQVTWSIPAEYRREGLAVSANGTVSFGLGLYNAFPTEADKTTANVLVRATSVADSSKYADCLIDLSFPDVEVDLDNLTYMVDRNSYIDLYDKLESIGLTAGDFKLVWSLHDDGGLGNKVSLDTATGTLSVDKDIDYSAEYVIEVRMTAISSGTQEVAYVQPIKVVVPKVSLTLSSSTCQMAIGSSSRIQFGINGLKTDASAVQVTSTPAVRNTLLYVQGNEMVISVGKDVTVEQFDVKLSLIGYPDIAQNATVLLLENELTGDELMGVPNVEGVYLHVPVPGDEGRAPSINEIKLEPVTRQINGYTVTYTYDWKRSRTYIQIGSGAIYFYEDVTGSDISWHAVNVENDIFYIPTSDDSAFPAMNGDTATLVYQGDTYTYQKFSYAQNTIYSVQSAETGLWYQYDSGSKMWRNCSTVVERAHGASVTASSDTAGCEATMATDGIYSSRWGSQMDHDPESITVDLGSVYAFDYMKIDWEGARAKDYDIKISTDGQTWTTVTVTNIEAGSAYGTRVDNGDVHYIDTLDNLGMAGMPVRYVMIEGKSRQLNAYGYSIWEIYIYTKGLKPYN